MALLVPSSSVNKSSDICSKGYYILWTLFILQLISCASCLFEDQIGKFDWRQHYIGKLKYATFDAVASTKKIFVATEQNVIAALNPKSGQIIWRQVLEREEAGHVQHLHVGSELISISGGPYVYVRAWDLTKGFLLWEWTLNEQISKDAKWTVDQKTLYHIVPVENSFVEIAAFNAATGADLGIRKLSAPWVRSPFSCAVVGSTYVCATKDSLYWANIADATELLQVPLSELKISVSTPHLEAVGNTACSLLTASGHQQILTVRSSGLKPLVQISTSMTMMSNTDANPLLIMVDSASEGSSLQIGALSLESGEEKLELSATLKLPESLHGAKQKLEAVTCSDKSCRILFSGDDHSITLVQHPGKVLWTREEALSSILAVEILDLPVSDMDAAIEKEFDNKEAGFVGMLGRRISSQLTQLRLTVLTVLGLGSHSSANQQAGLVRDGFGLHKMIVVATSAGKVFGIDNLSGEIIWQLQLPELAPFNVAGTEHLYLFVMRTTSHVPLPAQCALIGQHEGSDQGFAVVFNPMTGSKVQELNLGYKVHQVLQLPHPDENFLRGIIVLDSEEQAHVFPENCMESALAVAGVSYLYTADTSTGLLTGYSLAYSTSQRLIATRVWEVKLPSSEQLLAVASKSQAERVHSQGRVLADRSVMYKYLNPNLVAVVTHSTDPVHKHLLNVYLVDSVSGAMVFSATHKRAKGPIHIVHSENWVVYSFYNEKSRRTEIATLELYEGKTQSNSTAFSSMSSLIQPIVERQAFIMPAVIESMRETITEKGITSKHILLALSSGGILQLPWMFVDPRRPVIASAEMRDEGVIPYVPELPVPPDAIINYNQSVHRIRGIHTAPSGLESTCLVLAYGLDLFYTRVAPSKTFDLLKDDFDHFLISAVLLGLVIASYATKKLASRKALKQAWK